MARRPANPSALSEDFRGLLVAWRLHNPGAFLTAKHAREFPASETTWGDDHYQQRALLLSVAVELLRRNGTDLDTVAGVLAGAKDERLREVLKVERFRSGTAATLDEWERRRVAMVRQLERYQALYGPEGIRIPRDDVFDAISVVLRLMKGQRVREVQRSAAEYAGLKPEGGRPRTTTTPAVERARTALGRAGVPPRLKFFKRELLRAHCDAIPPNPIDALLMAVGVLPVRFPP